MVIRAVIFDFGGVLIQMGDDAPRLELADRLGVPLKELDRLVFDSETALKAMVGEISVEKHWQAVGEAIGVAGAEMPGVMAHFWAADEINDELVAVIDKLRDAYKIGLLSNAWDDLRQVLETRIPIAHLFDDMVISAEVGMGKPDPRIFRLAVEKLAVRADEAVFVDDMLENVLAAQKVGLQAVHYQNNAQLFSDLRSYNLQIDND